MHDALVSRGVIPRLTLRLRSDPGRAVRGAARWLEADARDVVVLRPSRRRSDRPSATALLPGLRRWRVLVARRRAIAVVRRALLVAATVAIVLTAIAHGGALPTAVVIAAPLAVALLGAALVLRRRPELPAVARLLDARLALHEQLGTALELETAPRGAAHPLDARVVADASQTVSSTLGGSRAVARRARGEWLALLAAAAAVVALALTSGTSHGGAAPVQHARAQAPHSSGAAAAARRRAQRPATTANGPVRPRFNPYTNGFQNAYQRALARQLAAHPELSYTSPGLRPDIAQAGAAPGRSGAVQHPQSAGSSSGTAATAPSPSAAASPASGAVTPIGRATPAGAGAGAGAGGAQRRSAAPLAGAPGAAAPAAAGTPGQNAQNAPAGVRGGAPTGGTEAGHARGTTQSATRAPAQLAAGPQGLPLQGAYEPGRPGGKAQAGETGGGGGGHGRNRAIGGGVNSSPSLSAFPYIPPDAASIPSARQDLLTNYLEVITSLAGRSW